MVSKHVHHLIFSLTALALLAACGPAAPSPSPAATLLPTGTRVPATATVTTRPQTPTPTPEGSVLSPFGIEDLPSQANGSLWVFINNNIGYSKYDFDSSEFTRVFMQSRCDKHLLYGTIKVLCVRDNQLSLFDMQTKEYEELGIPTPAWIGSTQNGKFLFYGYLTDEDEVQVIEVYDLSMREVVSSGTANVTNWYGQGDTPQEPGGWVSLSPDGKILSVLRYTIHTSSIALKISLLDMESFTIFRLKPHGR